jgi:hypothetical protein
MEIIQQEEYDLLLTRLVESLENRRLVLFLGPGALAGARLSATRKPVLTNDQLANKLIDELLDINEKQFFKDHILKSAHAFFPGSSVSQAAEIFEAKFNRSQLVEFLKEEFGDCESKWLHNLVWYLPFSAIYTTNYDTLVEQAEEEHLVEFKVGARRGIRAIYDEKSYLDYRNNLGRELTPYFKLLGCLKAGNIVITSEDYVRFLSKISSSAITQNLESCLSDINQDKLFIGFGSENTALLNIIFSVCQNNLAELPISYATSNPLNNLVAHYWYEHFGISTIPCDSELFLADLLNRMGAPSSPWEQFLRMLTASHFSGMSLFGQSKKDKFFDRMREECQQKQVVSASIEIPQIGTLEDNNRQRIIFLLKDLGQQIDSQLSEAGIIDLGLYEEISSHENAIRAEVESWFIDNREQYIWSKDDKNLRDYEDRLSSRASHLFLDKLWVKFRKRRLIIFVHNFERIEDDNSLFHTMVKHLWGNLAREDNIGLVLIRCTNRPIIDSLNRYLTVESLGYFTEFNTADIQDEE